MPAAIQTNPMTRIDHAKPMLGVRYIIMRGNTTPPVPPAVHAMPVARALRFENQCPMAEMLGLKSIDADMPPRTPKDNKNW